LKIRRFFTFVGLVCFREIKRLFFDDCIPRAHDEWDSYERMVPMMTAMFLNELCDRGANPAPAADSKGWNLLTLAATVLRGCRSAWLVRKTFRLAGVLRLVFDTAALRAFHRRKHTGKMPVPLKITLKHTKTH